MALDRTTMADDPRDHPFYLLLLALAAVGTIPIAFVGRPTSLLLGLPIWLWSSLGFTAVLSGLTVWGLLRYWRDDEDES